MNTTLRTLAILAISMMIFAAQPMRVNAADPAPPPPQQTNTKTSSGAELLSSLVPISDARVTATAYPYRRLSSLSPGQRARFGFSLDSRSFASERRFIAMYLRDPAGRYTRIYGKWVTVPARREVMDAAYATIPSSARTGTWHIQVDSWIHSGTEWVPDDVSQKAFTVSRIGTARATVMNLVSDAGRCAWDSNRGRIPWSLTRGQPSYLNFVRHTRYERIETGARPAQALLTHPAPRPGLVWRLYDVRGTCTLPRPIRAGDQIEAEVGLLAGYSGRVFFRIGVPLSGGDVHYFPTRRATNDGRLDRMNFDLSRFAGHRQIQIMAVSDNGASTDYGVWTKALVTGTP